MEMVQPYMDGVLYNRPQQPSLSRNSRSSKINRTVKKSKPCILMITDGWLGHSNDIEDDGNDDDDFVDPPLRRQRTLFSVRSSIDPLMELDKMYVKLLMDQLLKHEVTDLRKNNTELSTKINDVKEQLLS
ncbi:Hypothetical predicted protein [Olea europaea subsp. europaea]|uniref:Uncharacterized protein n=1 Tax=Olea europaea subsp. europaea TaxID=158383 RepID=A0A8S0PN42_OLEEU|nr:Hypothetical predicted protein [Olea europaea subsp. europaea]